MHARSCASVRVLAQLAVLVAALCEVQHLGFVPSVARVSRAGAAASTQQLAVVSNVKRSADAGFSATPGVCCAFFSTALLAGALAQRLSRGRTGALRSRHSLLAFEDDIGAIPPLGYWDPLGMSKDGDVNLYKRRRASEVKHGRVCMLATIGYIVPEYFRFPGEISKGVLFADMPNGLEAAGKVPEATAAGVVAILLCGDLENRPYCQEGDREPGDFKNVGVYGIPFAEGVADPEEKKRKLNSEMANGRLAMLAIMGMMVQNGLTGSTGVSMYFPSE